MAVIQNELTLIVLFAAVFYGVLALPEQGKWDIVMNKV